MAVETAINKRKEIVKEVTRVEDSKFKFQLKYLGPVVAFVIFISLWQAIPTILEIKSFILPKPTDVVAAAIKDWHLLWPAMQITIVEAVIGFSQRAVSGFLASILLAR